MSKVQVDTIDTRSGTSTMQIGSTNTSTINIGVSGDTVNIPAGVTIANAGTATGFGGNNTPAFLVTRSGNQSIADSTTTKIQWNSELFDTDNTFDSSTNYRFTPGVAGKYILAAGTRASSFETSEKMQLFFYKNGSKVSYQTETRNYSPSSGGETVTVDSQILVESDADDYFEVFLLQTEGGSRDIGSNSYFYGYKLIGA